MTYRKGVRLLALMRSAWHQDRPANPATPVFMLCTAMCRIVYTLHMQLQMYAHAFRSVPVSLPVCMHAAAKLAPSSVFRSVTRRETTESPPRGLLPTSAAELQGTASPR